MKNTLMNLHSRPLCRRDFISRGMMAGGATMVLPTLGGMLTNQAWAQDKTHIPFVVFDLAGGAALPANFLVGGKAGPKSLLKSYSLLGWNPKKDTLDERFGLPMAGGGISKILTGLTTAASAEAQAKLRFASLLHTAAIDTSVNPLSALSLVAKSGSKGSDISGPIGLRTTISGGNSKYTYDDANFRAMGVQKLDDLLNAVGLGGALSGTPDVSKSILGRLVNRLSMAQAESVLSRPVDAAALKNLSETFKGVSDKVKASSGLDPRRDPMFSQIYGVDENSSPGSQDVLRAAVMMGILKRVTGPGVITIDGCDYHDSTQASGDTKDEEIGREIGRAVEAAHRLKTPLFIQIITDGGIYPKDSSRVWLGDSPDTCMSAIGFFNPDSVPAYVDGRMQVGDYTDGQGANRKTTIGDSAQLAGYAAFANYLKVSGRIKEFQTLAPNIFNEKELLEVTVFG